MARVVYDTNAAPPRRHEAAKGVLSLLKAEATFATVLGSADNVFLGRAPASGPDKRIVVRRRRDAGGEETTLHGVTSTVVQIMTESAESIRNPDDWHSAVHDDVDEFLTGKTITMTHGKDEMGVRRIKDDDPVSYDADAEVYYSTAEYEVTMTPKTS